MRTTLKNLIDSTIVFSYSLPNSSLSFNKSLFSTEDDQCFQCTNPIDLSSVIYNSLIDYAYNQFDVSGKDFDMMMPRVLDRINYKSGATATAKLKYGFHGETLLFCILFAKMHAVPIIARGYMYDPLHGGESFGYDSYHLIQNGTTTELWFGEVKFRQTYRSCINSALENLNKAISDDYLAKNFVALQRFVNNYNIVGTKV